MSKFAPRFTVCLLLSLLTLAASAAQQDIIFIFDNSGSMRKADPAFAARDEAKKFLGSLGTDVNAGVIVFDQDVTLTAPLAPVGDGSPLAAALDGVNYKGKFTNSPAAVERAIYELKTNGRPDAQKAVVFMTDGIVDIGNRQEDAERTRWLREDLVADAVLNGIRIHGVAFTGAADLLLIQSLAAKTGAEYFRAPAAADLPAALAKVLEVLNKAPAPEAPAVAEPAPVVPPPAAEVVPPAVVEPVPPEVAADTAPEPAPPAAGGPALSQEERESLEQLSKETGIPIEQLIKELESAEPGQAVVMRPGDELPAEPAPALSMGTLGAVGAAILAVLLALWFIFRSRGDQPKNETTKAAAVPASAAPAARFAPAGTAEAWFIDINGLSGEQPRKLTDKPMMIGRIAGSDPDYLDYYVVNKATIGRRHAVIKHKDRAYWIVDQGSVNGTFVNDEKVLGERQLRHGDRVKFHKFEFEFQCPDGVNQTVVGFPADQTIVAAMDQTLAAGSTAALAATGAQPAADTIARAATGLAAGAGAAAAVSAADDMFNIGDIGDIGDEGDVTAIDGDLEALEDDRNAFFNGSGKHAAPSVDQKTQVLNAAEPDEFEFEEVEDEPETLAVSDLLDNTAVRAEAEFDADASAFFEDFTVSPASDRLKMGNLDPDLDVLDITVARDPRSLPGADISEGEDFATATTLMPSHANVMDGTSKQMSTGTFGQMDTVLNASVGSSEDGDQTLEDFLATSSFDSIPQPPDSPLPGEGTTSFDDFLAESGHLGTALEDTNDLAELQASEAAEDVFDVTGEMDVDHHKTTILPSSPVDQPPPMDTVVLPNSPYTGNKPRG